MFAHLAKGDREVPGGVCHARGLAAVQRQVSVEVQKHGAALPVWWGEEREAVGKEGG